MDGLMGSGLTNDIEMDGWMDDTMMDRYTDRWTDRQSNDGWMEG